MKSENYCLAVVKDLLVYRNTVVIIVTPLALLPLVLCIPTTVAACGYCLILMAVYWIMEAMPLPVTALLPIILFPMMGIMTGKQVASAYIADTSLVFMGAFILAIAVEKSNLHSRVSLKILTLVGSRESMLLLGFMLPTWFLSMWMSNTATTVMMIPVAEAVIQQKRAELDNAQKHKLTQEKPPQEILNGDTNSIIINGPVGSTSSSDSTIEITCFRETSEDLYLPRTNSMLPAKQTYELAATTYETKHDSTCEPKLATTIHETTLPTYETTLPTCETTLPTCETTLPTCDRKHITDEQYKELVRKHDNFAKMMLLSIAYAANIGGTATLIGTPTNLLVAQMTTTVWESHGMTSPVTFISWMFFGIPHAIVCLFVAWVWLIFFYLGWRSLCCCFLRDKLSSESDYQQLIKEKYKQLGPISFSEVSVTILFLILVVLWFARDPGFAPGYSSLFKIGYVTDAVPAFFIATLLFILPSERPRWMCFRGKEESRARTVPSLVDWNTVSQKLPWGSLILLGGGYTLAEGCDKSGLSVFLGEQLKHLNVLPTWLIAFIVITFVAFFTEITSNSVVISIVLPMLVAMAADLNINPLYLMLPAGIAASYAFMLPVATPPNAIIFSYGRLQVQDMAKAGLMMNVLCILICMLGLSTWGMAIFDLDVLPWAADTSNATTAPTAFNLIAQ